MKAPDEVYLFGAGRWSRVMLTVLSERVPEGAKIFVVSARHAPVMQAWVRERRSLHGVRVLTSLPDEVSSTGVVIVANAAADHARCAHEALVRRLPVLVEKPVGPTAAVVGDLISLAKANNTILAAAHVLLFAEYLRRFAAALGTLSGLSSIRLVWSDPPGEERYGEAKTFDVSVPIVADVFPHIMSILWSILPVASISHQSSSIAPGGLEATLQLSVAGSPCTVELTRTGQKRIRMLEVQTDKGGLVLDFAVEPGTITDRRGEFPADPGWQSRPSPLALQLTSFFEAASGGPLDDRLDPRLAYKASAIVDEIMVDGPRVS